MKTPQVLPDRKFGRGDIVAKRAYPVLAGRITQLNSNNNVQFANVFWFYDGGCLECRIPVADLRCADNK
jgi:hypothetical protein